MMIWQEQTPVSNFERHKGAQEVPGVEESKMGTERLPALEATSCHRK